jgi:hypothetical protein
MCPTSVDGWCDMQGCEPDTIEVHAVQEDSSIHNFDWKRAPRKIMDWTRNVHKSVDYVEPVVTEPLLLMIYLIVKKQ